MLLELGFEIYVLNRTWGLLITWGILVALLYALARKLPHSTLSYQLIVRIIAFGLMQSTYSVLVIAWMTSYGGPAKAGPSIGVLGFIQATQTLPVGSMILTIVTDRYDPGSAWFLRWFDRAAIATTIGAIVLTMVLIWT